MFFSMKWLVDEMAQPQTLHAYSVIMSVQFYKENKDFL